MFQTLNSGQMAICVFVAIVFWLLFMDWRFDYRKHDQKMVEMMKRGEGPDYYVTINGKFIVNARLLSNQRKID